MILASSLLCNSRSSGVSSVGDQEEGTTSAGNLTLAVVGDNNHDLSPVHIDRGFDCGSQFTIRGRKEMMNRLDDGELGAQTLVLNDPLI